MIWLTWRQFRIQGIVMAAILAVFGLLLLVTGPHLASVARATGFAACHSGCAASAQNFLTRLNPPYHLIYLLGAVLIILLPAVIGLFWGAPLIARELDTGTFRLVWNQGVTRERWLATKLAVLGLASMAAAGLLSLILGWWASPIDHAGAISASGGYESRFFPVVFGTRGIAPLGYAAFAFALGVLIGLLIRRTVPAMAVTLGLLAAVQIAFPLLVRPYLISPVRQTAIVTAASIDGLSTNQNGTLVQVMAQPPSLPGAWVYSSNVVDKAGSANLGALPASCPQPNGGPGQSGPASMQNCFQALAAKDLKQVTVYQPASRYWTFQALEFGIYLTAAILLAWGCFWAIRRRLS
jgi:ABC-type transport system involved in multi-copper enzyme maturation permease subunit